MAKGKRVRKTYTDAQRTEILAAATKDGLTAVQVQKKFGVTPVTYYSWRKKKGVTGRRGPGRPPGRPAGSTDLHSQVRAEVQSKLRQILPEIVRTEVNAHLDSLFGRRGPGRPRKHR